jgi:hypothetical protein
MNSLQSIQTKTNTKNDFEIMMKGIKYQQFDEEFIL